jgi:lysozyme
MKINQATIDLVKKWEGFKSKAYICPAGVLTVGYGTTNRAGIPGVNITRDTVVTEAEASHWLQLGLEKFSDNIKLFISAPINENEFGAFLSLAYNIGPTAFRGSSALRHFNNGDKAKAAESIKLWNKATINGKRQVLQGLVNRREEEVALFLAPVKVVKSRSNPIQSTTIQASTTQVLAGGGTVLTGIGVLDGTAQLLLIGLGAIIVLAGLWVARERLRKWANGDH